MKKMRKLVSILLAITMLLSSMCMGVSADELPKVTFGGEETIEAEEIVNEDELPTEILPEDTIIEDSGNEPAMMAGEKAIISGSCGETVRWTYDGEGTMLITGRGPMDDYLYNPYGYDDGQPWYKFREDIQVLIVDSGVTRIGVRAFYNCVNLGIVTLPDGLTSIGVNAFANCNYLSSIDVPDGVTIIDNSAFSSCKELSHVTLPNTLNTIGNKAFEACTKLNYINLPDSLTFIGASAFYNCDKLTEITIPENITDIRAQTFYDCDGLTKVALPEGLKGIGGSAFSSCSKLTRIVIPKSVTIIDAYAFADCNSLNTIDVKDGNMNYTDVDGILFSKDKKTLLCYPAGKTDTAYTVPSEVTEIADGAFYTCSNLNKVVISDNVTSVGNRAFGNCKNLTSVTLSGNMTSLSEYMFSGCSKLSNIVIPESVTSIGYSSFSGCTSLRNIVIPESVTSIGDGSFRNCTSLGNIVIPESVTSIGYDSFSGCTSLSSIEIPVNVTSIGYSAFYRCSNLKDVYYGGSEEQWNAIEIGNDNKELLNATIHFEGETHTHSYTYNVTKAATCTEEGSVTYTCSCGDQYTEVIEKLMHSEYVVSGTEPTATSPGLTEGKVCAVCGEITQPQQEIPPIGAVAHGTHGNLTWVLYEDGELVISGEGDMAVDPDYLYPWLEIGYVSQIKKLTIAEGVTSIAREAFDSCRALEEVTLPGSLTFIDTFAFDNCDRLTDVYYGGSAAEWRKVQIEWYNTPLTSAQLYIGGKAVVDQGTHGDNLTWVLHPDGELVISGEGAMKENGIVAFPWRVSHENDITKVTIGDGITSIAESAFSGCKNVESVEIPESVTSIGMSAFMNCVNLKSIEIPETVTYIGNASFYNCRSLESINIPKAVSEIPYNTFCYCSALKDVYYSGSKTEWNAVVIDVRDSGNDPLLNATMHFAVEEEITVGNINGDGAIDSSDVNLLYRSVMDYEELAAEQQAAADVNSDGKFNSADVNLLYRYVMGYVQNLAA